MQLRRSPTSVNRPRQDFIPKLREKVDKCNQRFKLLYSPTIQQRPIQDNDDTNDNEGNQQTQNETMETNGLLDLHPTVQWETERQLDAAFQEPSSVVGTSNSETDSLATPVTQVPELSISDPPILPTPNNEHFIIRNTNTEITATTMTTTNTTFGNQDNIVSTTNTQEHQDLTTQTRTSNTDTTNQLLIQEFTTPKGLVPRIVYGNRGKKLLKALEKSLNEDGPTSILVWLNTPKVIERKNVKQTFIEEYTEDVKQRLSFRKFEYGNIGDAFRLLQNENSQRATPTQEQIDELFPLKDPATPSPE